MNRIGSFLNNNNCFFRVWAPKANNLILKIIGDKIETFPMQKDEENYWSINLPQVKPGTLYKYQIDDQGTFPDPASNFQPEGVHGPSMIIDHSEYNWSDKKWKPHKLKDVIIYEMHIGTFTNEGTYLSAIEKLKEIKDLGITAIEIMPLAQFTGRKNWGYDGVFPFAPQNCYGSPGDLKKLIDSAHEIGLSVYLDVVYNHLGPEGNYLNKFGYYFTSCYGTPWGEAINFDEAYSDHVRNYFIQNALYWLKEFHFDGLRFDAIPMIYDIGAKHILLEINEKIKKLSKNTGKKYLTFAESDLNDIKVINPLNKGGYGFDAQWNFDFHHSLHAFLTKETRGYYKDFGSIDQLVKSLNKSFVYDGLYSKYRMRTKGKGSGNNPTKQFVIYVQNHDEIGNRVFGDRLISSLPFELIKLCASLAVLSPYVPLLFMGEEYAEDAPFHFFVHHNDEYLIDSIRKGRLSEYEFSELNDKVSDPYDDQMFELSKLDHNKKKLNSHNIMLTFYKNLFELRKKLNPVHKFKRKNFSYELIDDLIIKYNVGNKFISFMNFDSSPHEINSKKIKEKYFKIFDSSDKRLNGSGSLSPEKISAKSLIFLNAYSFAMYEKIKT